MTLLRQFEINELCLNIPGLTQTEANLIGKNVVRILGEGINTHNNNPSRNSETGSMDITVDIPLGTPKDKLSALIAAQVFKSME